MASFKAIVSVLFYSTCLSIPLSYNIKSEKYRQLGFWKSSENGIPLNPIHWFQFADDAAVVSGQEKENQMLLNRFTIWCQWAQMIIRVDKCSTFGIRKQLTKSIQYLRKLFVNNCLVPRVELGKSFRYLGRYFNFNMSDEDHKSEVYDTLTNILNEIDDLPLHPKNKILLYSRYVLSKISSHFTVSDIGKTWVIDKLDSIESTYIRKWLELPISATLSNVLLPHNKFGLNIILPSTKFLQCQTVSRKALKSSPNEAINNLWKDTSNHKNVQYDKYKNTKDVLNTIRKQHEDKLQHHLISQGSFFSNIIKHSTLSHNSWNLCFVTGNIDETLSKWCDMFLKAVDEYIPKHCIKNSYDHPWIDKELLQLIRRKNTQRKKLKKFPNQVNVDKYKNLRRLTKQLIKKKKKNYSGKLAESLHENPRRFWAVVKHSTANRKNITILKNGQSYSTDKCEMANILNKYFHSVFSPKDSDVFATSPSPLTSSTHELSDIQLTEAEVISVLRNLDPRKAYGPDNIPNRLLVELAYVIGPSLCELFNMSLALGEVPCKWKEANITPAFKREDPTLAMNYRPISLLCTLSKVLERCVYNHCYHHLEPRIYDLQHGFMRGKCTTTQLLEVYHCILDSVASGKQVDAIYLDLSKAFDKVPHHLLLRKLSNFGIHGSLLSWFHSYLSDRRQRVVLQGVYSEWLPVTSGVPQGSILGPLLFLVYCNDIQSYIQKSKLALFADDSKLYLPLVQSDSTHLLQHDLDNLITWTTDNQMELNNTKCKAMRISRKNTPAQTNYSINGHIIEQVTNFKDLGVVVSKDLSWSQHINSIVSKANKTLGLIKRICKEVENVKTRRTLYCALVRPKLEYASNVWSPYTVKHKLLIENVQRRATRFILNYPKGMCYKERLQKTSLLPLEFRREISDLILLFKAKYDLIGMDLTKYICTFNPGYKSRNYDENDFHLIIKHNQDYFRKSYFIRSAKLWNSLPSVIKTSNTLTSFRTRVINLYNRKLITYNLPSISY